MQNAIQIEAEIVLQRGSDCARLVGRVDGRFFQLAAEIDAPIAIVEVRLKANGVENIDGEVNQIFSCSEQVYEETEWSVFAQEAMHLRGQNPLWDRKDSCGDRTWN